MDHLCREYESGVKIFLTSGLYGQILYRVCDVGGGVCRYADDAYCAESYAQCFDDIFFERPVFW